jgi:hypothetical protein
LLFRPYNCRQHLLPLHSRISQVCFSPIRFKGPHWLIWLYLRSEPPLRCCFAIITLVLQTCATNTAVPYCRFEGCLRCFPCLLLAALSCVQALDGWCGGDFPGGLSRVGTCSSFVLFTFCYWLFQMEVQAFCSFCFPTGLQKNYFREFFANYERPAGISAASTAFAVKIMATLHSEISGYRKIHTTVPVAAKNLSPVAFSCWLAALSLFCSTFFNCCPFRYCSSS